MKKLLLALIVISSLVSCNKKDSGVDIENQIENERKTSEALIDLAKQVEYRCEEEEACRKDVLVILGKLDGNVFKCQGIRVGADKILVPGHCTKGVTNHYDLIAISLSSEGEKNKIHTIVNIKTSDRGVFTSSVLTTFDQSVNEFSASNVRNHVLDNNDRLSIYVIDNDKNVFEQSERSCKASKYNMFDSHPAFLYMKNCSTEQGMSGALVVDEDGDMIGFLDKIMSRQTIKTLLGFDLDFPLSQVVKINCSYRAENGCNDVVEHKFRASQYNRGFTLPRYIQGMKITKIDIFDIENNGKELVSYELPECIKNNEVFSNWMFDRNKKSIVTKKCIESFDYKEDLLPLGHSELNCEDQNIIILNNKDNYYFSAKINDKSVTKLLNKCNF